MALCCTILALYFQEALIKSEMENIVIPETNAPAINLLQEKEPPKMIIFQFDSREILVKFWRINAIGSSTPIIPVLATK